jgi:elongator complex protein 1
MLNSVKGLLTNEREKAIKYIAVFVDIDQLYNVALGMYDFDLTMLVAQQSQKDPREYVPFLNELKRTPAPYRYFCIDNHLQRYEKACRHLSQCT